MSPGVTPRGYRVDLQDVDIVDLLEALKAEFPNAGPLAKINLLRILTDFAIAERLDRLNVAVQGPRPPSGWIK